MATITELRRKYEITVSTHEGEKTLTVEATGIRDAILAASTELESHGITHWSLVGSVRLAP